MNDITLTQRVTFFKEFLIHEGVYKEFVKALNDHFGVNPKAFEAFMDSISREEYSKALNYAFIWTAYELRGDKQWVDINRNWKAHIINYPKLKSPLSFTNNKTTKL